MKRVALVSLALTTLAVSSASAQVVVEEHHHHSTSDGLVDSMHARIHLFGAGGFLGDASTSSGSDERTDELEPTWGGGVGFEMPIVPMFSLGGEVGFHTWNMNDTENLGLDRNLFVDFSVEPRLRIPIAAGKSHIAFYLGMPLGFTLDFLDDDYSRAFELVGGDIDTGYGFHLGWRLGTQFFIVRNFGVFGDIGSTWRTVTHQVTVAGDDDQIDVETHQLTARVGLSLGL